MISVISSHMGPAYVETPCINQRGLFKNLVDKILDTF